MGVLFSVTGNDTSARLTTTATAFATTLFLLAFAVAAAFATAFATAFAVTVAPLRIHVFLRSLRHLHGTLKLMTH